MVLANAVSSVLVMNTEFQRLYSVITSSNKGITLANRYRALKDLQDDTNFVSKSTGTVANKTLMKEFPIAV